MSQHSSEEEYELVDESEYEYIESENGEESDEVESSEENVPQEEEEKTGEHETPEDVRSEFGTVVSDYTYPTSKFGGPDEYEVEVDDLWTGRLNLLRHLFKGSPDIERMEERALSAQGLIEATKMSMELEEEQLKLLLADVEALLDQIIDLGLHVPYVGDLLVELIDDLLGFGWDYVSSKEWIHATLYALAQAHTNLNCIRTAVKQVYFIVDRGQWLHKADAVRIAEAAMLGNWLGDLQVYIYAVQLYTKLMEDRAVDLITTLDLRVYDKLSHCDVRYVPSKHQKLAWCIQAYLEPRLSRVVSNSVFENYDVLLCTDLYKIWVRPDMLSSSYFSAIIERAFHNLESELATIVLVALYCECFESIASAESQQTVIEWFRGLKRYCDLDDPGMMAISSSLESQAGQYGTTSENPKNNNIDLIQEPSMKSESPRDEVDAAFDESNIDETTLPRDLINELNGIQVETQPKESKLQKDEMDAAFDESNIDETTLSRDLINELNGILDGTKPKESKLQKDEMDAARDESNIDDTTQF